MNLNLGERLITGNPVRAFIQRHIEGPMLRKMALRESYPLCLEIGCGQGIGALIIAEQFKAERVIAVDTDPMQIERARKRLSAQYKKTIEFKVEDAMSLKEPSGVFDAVFSFGVIHHTEDWRKAVGEVSRVLRAGGEFFFEEPLRGFVKFFIKGSVLSFIAEHPVGGIFSLEEFISELEKNNIEIKNLKRLGGIAVFGSGQKR